MNAKNKSGRGTIANVTRGMIALGWIAGALYNATSTVRHPELLADMFATSPLPLYRWLFDTVAKPHLVFWTWMVVAGEMIIGILMLARGTWARLGLLGSMLWSAFLFPLSWPYTLMMGPYALLNAWLLRRTYDRSLLDALRSIINSVRQHERAALRASRIKGGWYDDH